MEELKRKGWVNYFFAETLFKHYLDFSGKVSNKQFWLAYVWNLFIGGGYQCLLLGHPSLVMDYIMLL